MRIYNTLTGEKEEFVPINKEEVKIYSCGPTVYNFFHIGNARPFIIFDVLRRYLEYRGYNVRFVQNFTDIDDKIINKANEENIDFYELSEKYIKEYFIDAQGLGIKPATVHPKATENIDAIISLIKMLEKNGYAYEIDGDIYFDAKKFNNYGSLSGQSIDELEMGARIKVDKRKKNPMDFVLWKSAKPGEPQWDSPWGKGRPGWHIECSAMVFKHLGETIDIHCGGKDLVFPHHENEIAQSEAATGKKYVNYWLHNGFLNIENEKMSKSKGNFFTVRDISKKYRYEVIRFFMLSAHYRSPLNFSEYLMEQSKNGLERIYNCINNLEYIASDTAYPEKRENDIQFFEKLKMYKDKFILAMDDDLNTADAISVIFDIVKEINTLTAERKNISKDIITESIDLLKELGDVLGILKRDFKGHLDKEIEELISKRQQARKDKNWGLADEIRDKLKNKGIILEDTPTGVKWKRV